MNTHTHTHTQIKTTSNDNHMGFPDSSVVKTPSPTQEMWVQSLHWEDPLEKEMATHSSILSWEIPWTEDPDRPQSIGSQKIQTQLSD